MNSGGTIQFNLGGMVFEYDEEKNLANIRKHGISFRNAARVFFDYDRIELFDVENSIFFVVYTERIQIDDNGQTIDVTRLISARMATSFERGLYYGKLE